MTPKLSTLKNIIPTHIRSVGPLVSSVCRSVRHSGTTPRSLVDTCQSFGERRPPPPPFSGHYLFGYWLIDWVRDLTVPIHLGLK